MVNKELPANTTLSHYRIISKIGAGGMGDVYLAEDTRLGRKVALKLLPEQFTRDEDRVRRFEQEARAASALNHPNIITIHDIGRADECHFIATEFIDGQTVRQRMTPHRMELNSALDAALQVATALSAAHEARIIHRDIKPENVMLRRDGIVKVLDFGLAKLTERRAPMTDTGSPTALNPQKTDPGTVMGTAHYMSPEQARGVELDARSDIFSLGVMFYEMVTGRVPFSGATVTDIIIAIIQQEPAQVIRYAPEAPVELVRIVSKALVKDRDERYQTARDLQIDLKRLRQRLEFEAELERSARPEAGDASARIVGQVSVETAKQTAPDTEEAAVRTMSSAEYVSSIRRHKVAFGALALALVALISMGFYLLGGHGEEKAIESIAVLPFININADPNIEYLADGIPEGIINTLSQASKLKVMSRASAFRFKGSQTDAQEVGEKLGVQAVLTGRVAQRGEGLLISIELVSARDNRQIWGQQYNRKLSDVFALQEEMAKEVSEKLRLRLTGAERQQLAKRPTENLQAFQYYMQGQATAQRRTREDLLEAIRYYKKAIEEDRNYALAYAGLADAYMNLGGRTYIAPLEGRRKAEEAARTALALDENLAEAHVAMAEVYIYFAPFNLPPGDRELRRAIELSPSFAMAYVYLSVSLSRMGRLDEASAELVKARELDPLSPIIAKIALFPYYLKGDYARALELLRQSNELGPAFITIWDVEVYIKNGLLNEALAELEKAKRERKNDPILLYSLGMIDAAQDKKAEALQIINELEQMSGESRSQANFIARIYAALNEKELDMVGSKLKCRSDHGLS